MFSIECQYWNSKLMLWAIRLNVGEKKINIHRHAMGQINHKKIVTKNLFYIILYKLKKLKYFIKFTAFAVDNLYLRHINVYLPNFMKKCV